MADNPSFVTTYDLESGDDGGKDGKRLGSINNNVEAINHLTITWTNLCVQVGRGQFKRKTLTSFSGQLESKELVAIMGPSGSGKSTFLKCLSLRQVPNLGTVDYYSSTGKCDFSYVPQTDDLYIYLTVEESLLFASQFKNHFNHLGDHYGKVNQVMEQFGLKKCAKNYVYQCSGGEVRRLSMALEKVSDPDVLVLDEPTTGLDSFTTLSCMQTIKKAVTQDKLAVLMTIHQPSTEIFFMFDRVYFLSAGRCIYSGPPKEIPQTLSRFQLTCPPNCNPADLLMDVACRGAEDTTVKLLHKNYLKECIDADCHPELTLTHIKPEDWRKGRSFFAGLVVNAKRLLTSNLRDPQQSLTRLLEFLFVPLVILVLARQESFEVSSCTFRPLNETHMLSETSYEMFDRRKLAIQSVIYVLFNALFVLVASAFPATFTFTGFIKALIKEYQNNWYTFNSFFLAFAVVQILYSLFYSLANSIAIYFLSPKWFTLQTFAQFCCLNGILAIFGDVYGFLAGTIFAHSSILAVMSVTVILFLSMILSNFIIQTKYLLPYVDYSYALSTFQYIINMMLKVIFSLEPCQVEMDKGFTIRKVQDFIRFFNFENGHQFDDLEDVNEKLWTTWEEQNWTRENITSFMVNRYCLANSSCSLELSDKLNLFWDKKVNLINNDYQLSEVDIGRNMTTGVALILLHYIACYLVAFMRARAK